MVSLRWLSILAAALLLTACGPGGADRDHTGESYEAPSAGFVKAEALLTAYEPSFPFSEDSGGIHSDYVLPLATFSVTSPSQHEGRLVRVLLFSDHHANLVLAGNGSASGRYEMALPSDYFDHPDGTLIKDWLLRDFSRIEQSQIVAGGLSP